MVDRVFTNCEVRPLSGDDPEAPVAVTNGTVAAVGDPTDPSTADAETVDCRGGVLVPGFVDAHTHLRVVGRRAVEADLAGARLALGSDCMPLSPLYGVQQAVTVPELSQRLTVDEALRAFTRGGAYAGFDEDRMSTITPGIVADFAALSASPWEVPDGAISDRIVTLTISGGGVVFDANR